MIDLAQIVGRLLLSQAEVANTILSLSIIWCQAKIDPSNWKCSHPTTPPEGALASHLRRSAGGGLATLATKVAGAQLDVRAICHKILYLNI